MVLSLNWYGFELGYFKWLRPGLVTILETILLKTSKLKVVALGMVW